MKAVYFEKSGIENLKYGDFRDPELGSHDVLVKPVMAGVNPIDYFVVSGLPVTPIPHIPGAEIAGEVKKTGDHVKGFQEGDKVVVYNRSFDGTCDLCLSGKEQLCRNGGIISVIRNGGYSEFFSVPEKNLIKIPNDLHWEVAASLPVAALTSFHALREAQVTLGSTVVIFGASGNTGIFAMQLARRMGARVIAVSKKLWVNEFADYVFPYEGIEENVKRVTGGKMADVVLNSVGGDLWEVALKVLSPGGSMVFFGGLTSQKAEIQLSGIYSNHLKIIGTTGGTRWELENLTKMNLTTRTWKIFRLEEAKEALSNLFSKERDGRILIRY
ncbi:MULTISPECIES: alcohol dehydrogenase catalytic domain-containing protein [Acidianus]|uniref:Alcohol dehydrogenase n=1 Tax=Candidatus Acidianus copahuensis TaxID=1160895 RepID=A0A031LLE7_9CREN|nr:MULTISPECIES: alcohol dehydrogenase catalytic domain-containing protein [Acidianus]EZQ02059.1 alcohol dehydrogenase [Candidatus Acidianus copahuensis]NON63213.1 alcohol dehydrogenase catalytic domain-containing protein [Acidianus sp. RZ1]